MTNSGDGNPSLPFDGAFDGEDVERRIYGTVLQTREPESSGAIAERANCDPKTARKYLEWFSDLGIVSRYEGRPTTYERNDAYFEWRRIDALATEMTVDALRERITELTARVSEYEERYGARRPADVDALAVTESSDDRSVDEVYADLADWASVREERERHERARRQRSNADREPVTG